MITAIIKIKEGYAITDCALESKECLGDCANPEAVQIEGFLGRYNTPVQNGYARVWISEEYAASLEYLKAVQAAKEGSVEEVVKEEGDLKGDLIIGEPIISKSVDSKIDTYIIPYAWELVALPDEVAIEKLEKAEASFTKAVEYVETKVLPFEIISIEWEGQEMFHIADNPDGTVEYLGLCPGYMKGAA